MCVCVCVCDVTLFSLFWFVRRNEESIISTTRKLEVDIEEEEKVEEEKPSRSLFFF